MPDVQEYWGAIPGFSGYEVSSQGRVKSLDRVLITKAGWSRFHKGRTLSLKPGNGQGRYLAVALGKGNDKLVHRLVAEVFVENPDNLPEVNHKDEDTLNNFPDNLEWCTTQYNAEYSHNIPISFTTPLGMLVHFKNYKEASEYIGCHPVSVSRYARGLKGYSLMGFILWEE